MISYENILILLSLIPRDLKINLLIVDDHVVLREGIQELFARDTDIGSIEEASNGLDAILKAGKNRPDVVVMDFEMPKYNGIYAAKEMIKQQPGIPILLLSMFNDKQHILEAIKAGVKGYLSKDARIQEILLAVKALHNRETWFKGEIAEIITSYLIDSSSGHSSLQTSSGLTPRETEITCLYAEGKTATEIGKKLSISKRTVEVHKANIFKKLSIKSTIELLHYAIHHNIVKVI